jgi:hypothetical protein
MFWLAENADTSLQAGRSRDEGFISWLVCPIEVPDRLANNDAGREAVKPEQAFRSRLLEDFLNPVL